jgi:hypothetical protein
MRLGVITAEIVAGRTGEEASKGLAAGEPGRAIARRLVTSAVTAR